MTLFSYSGHKKRLLAGSFLFLGDFIFWGLINFFVGEHDLIASIMDSWLQGVTPHDNGNLSANDLYHATF